MKRILFIALVLGLTSPLVYAQSLSFNGLSEMEPLTRGKTYRLTWSGGTQDLPIVIRLFHANQTIEVWEGLYNDGETLIKLPKRMKSRDGYYFKISQPGTEEVTLTDKFQVKRKVPLALKIAGIAVLPVTMILVSQHNSSSRNPGFYEPSIPTP